MSAYQLKDFADIYTSILEELKIQSTDTVNLNRIKRIINEIYLDEVAPFKRWWWLSGHTDVEVKPYYGTGTASVTPASTTVTLSIAPGASDGSKAGYYFAVDGFDEIYTISTHTALSTTVVLTTPYTGTLNATATYKIWTDKVILPTDCRETVEVWHDFYKQTMEARGLQDFRKLVAEAPKQLARPYYYSTYDFVDPTPLTAETETDRYRILKVYPSVYDNSTTVHIDYVKEVAALELAGDEPLMPIEDRSVLKYGALSLAWASIQRNPEEAQRNRALFEQKLGRMAGKVEDTLDKPSLVPDSNYLVRKRGPRVKSMSRRLAGSGSSGGSYTSPTYAENITLNGGTFTGNFTATAGITIDGRDIGADGTTMDSHIAATSAVHGTTGSVVGTSDTQTLTNKTIVATSNTITEILNANIGATAAITRSKTASGTAYRILANTSAGVMSENAALTSGKMVKADANGQLADATNTDAEVAALVAGTPTPTSATLADNTASATLVTSWAHATYDSVTVNYSLKRGTSNKASGVLKICTDGTNASIAQSEASIGTLGVTFTVDISGANLRLLYTTTSTGTAATMKYKSEVWLS